MFIARFDFHQIPIPECHETRIKKVNQFMMTYKLGMGTSSKVYLAVDSETGKQYAAKAIRLGANKSAYSCLTREIKLLRQLNNKHIVKLHQVLHDKQKNIAYLIIDYADCGTLAELIQKPSFLSEKDIASIFLQVAQGLNYLHSLGISHEDIKPSNILITSTGNVLISDFGIGRSFSSTESILGSPAYQAPELFSEDFASIIDPAKLDIWSLGVTLYQTVFKTFPFDGENVYEIAHAASQSEHIEYPPNIHISPNLHNLIESMLKTNPVDRIDLAKILEHPFFTNAEELKMHSNKKRFSLPKSHSISQTSAIVCDEDYEFPIKERQSSSLPDSFYLFPPN